MASLNEIDVSKLRAAAAQASMLMKVLSNPDRLLLICQMTQGEFSVNDLETMTGIGQPTLSQQLAVLRGQQLVTTRREGKQIFYCISSSEARAVLQLMYQLYCPEPGTP